MAKKERDLEIIEKVAEIVAKDPNSSQRSISSKVGVSKTEITRILPKPITRERVQTKLAQSGALDQTNRSISGILTTLAIVTNDIIDAGVVEDGQITKLLQLLNALTTATERLARVGVDIGRVLDPRADAALRAELRLAFARGLRAAMRWPSRAPSTAAKLERKDAGPPGAADIGKDAGNA